MPRWAEIGRLPPCYRAGRLSGPFSCARSPFSLLRVGEREEEPCALSVRPGAGTLRGRYFLAPGAALMVFPLSDDDSDRRTVPYVNYVLIAVNVLVFVALQ